MSFVVEAVGDVVGGVVDAVGAVAEGVVDLAGSAIEAVADNPLMIAAAIAAPYALGAMASTAAAGTGISLAGAATGPGLAFAPSLGAGIGSAGITSAGLGAFGGSMGISSAALGAAAAGTALGGSTFGSSAMFDPFNFSPISESTNFGSSILQAADESLATFNQTQTAASSVLSNQPSFAFNTDYTSSSFFTEAKEAASLVNSPGMSFSNALSTATNGAIAPNPSTSIFSSAWDSVKGIAQAAQDLNSQASKFMGQIGETIAPGADPMVQKYITNVGANTVANGGDVEQAIKSSAIGTAAGVVGSNVAGATADTLGKANAGMLANAAANATGTALSGGDVGQSLIGSGIGAGVNFAGKGITDLTGSSLLGGAAKAATGTALGGGDVGQSLLNYGKNVATDTAGNYLTNLIPTSNINPNSPLGMIKSAATNSLTGMLSGAPAPKPANLLASTAAKIAKPSVLSAIKAPNVLQAATSGNKPQSLTNAPPQKVDVSTLKPVTDLSAIMGKLKT